jgi:hypothetical protein
MRPSEHTLLDMEFIFGYVVIKAEIRYNGCNQHNGRKKDRNNNKEQ